MSIAAQIVCDVCGLTVNCGMGVQREKPHVIRARLQEYGWKIAPPMDLCKSCKGRSRGLDKGIQQLILPNIDVEGK